MLCRLTRPVRIDFEGALKYLFVGGSESYETREKRENDGRENLVQGTERLNYRCLFPVVVKVVVASTQSLDFYLIMAAALLRGLRDPGGVGVVERVPNGRSATSHSAQSSCAAGRVKIGSEGALAPVCPQNRAYGSVHGSSRQPYPPIHVKPMR